jgi:hypothetical protein
LSRVSGDVKLSSSTPPLDVNDPKGKQEPMRREVRDTDTGAKLVTGDLTIAKGAGDMGELADCVWAGEKAGE